eukprot:CAMPEP_0196581462 /NCGR_PEP_ID=MMETSP1081-20130531/33976_1 /TAXON_ID=36882 /ORGANISM="Pyramimonas amylifera, Strain CCMP720" /LENGTH=206 /DNA_ID=CAMNT_0041901699 /DNA_START=110 /DNA_END=730 /DNA_ORIENTATION=-
MKFTYFGMEGGRGGACRAALMHAGIDFEDEKITWAGYQAKVAEGTMQPVGLPVLTLDNGIVVTQSAAILRYAGKKSDLYPTDADLALSVDEIIDILADLMSKCPQDADAEVKKTKREEYAAGRMKTYFELLNTKATNSEGEFLTGSSMSIADLVFFYTVAMIRDGMFDYVDKSYVDTWPKLVAVEKAIGSHSAVQKYKEAFAAASK